jgi:tripartite-type tricarboxylate transporter receptor subunit TctC
MRHEVSVVVVRQAAGVKSIEEAKKVALVMGATSPTALNAIHAKAINNVLGTKFRIVTGYKETAAIDLAMERGEVDGSAGGTWYGAKDPNFERVQSGFLRILVQVGLHKAPDLENVPLLTDLAQNEDEKQLLELFSSPAAVGKPTVVGPHVPPERVAELRAAYADTMKDSEFLEEAERLGIPISPITGDALAALVKDIYATPAHLVQRARGAIGE